MRAKKKSAPEIPGLWQLESDGRPLVAVFHAKWCKVCKAALPEVEKAAAEKFKVVAIDVDEYPDLSNALKISSVPTAIGFHGGRASYGVVGRLSPRSLQTFLAKVEKFHADNAAAAAANSIPAISRSIKVYKPLKLKQAG
jgi:thioredoxin 1